MLLLATAIKHGYNKQPSFDAILTAPGNSISLKQDLRGFPVCPAFSPKGEANIPSKLASTQQYSTTVLQATKNLKLSARLKGSDFRKEAIRKINHLEIQKSRDRYINHYHRKGCRPLYQYAHKWDYRYISRKFCCQYIR
jgi:hypothetical protein